MAVGRGLPHLVAAVCPPLSSQISPHLTSNALYPAQKKTRVKIWLYEDTRMALEGQIIGFDEYMNFVLEGATEVDTKTGKKNEVGRILLKGDAISVLQEA